MKQFQRFCAQLPRFVLGWSLASAQAISLTVFFITLIVPSQYLVAEQPSSVVAATIPPAAVPTASPSKAIVRAPHRLGAPSRSGPVAVDKWKPLHKRQPNEVGLYKSGASLRALDLKRVPSENDLRMAGQLGSPLTPTGSADPSKISDPAKRKRQEADNMLFGEAMQKWNQHDYKGAVAVFEKHRLTHSESVWAGEVELHLGCEAQFSGSWDEAKVHFEQVLDAEPKGSEIYQKVKLRRAVLHMDQGELDQAAQTFAEMLQTETDWQRRTYAQRWLLDLSHFKGHELALRTCGSNSIAYVLRVQGKDQLAANVANLPAPSDQGFSLRELVDLATKSGLEATAVRADGTNDLERLPTPFIAHYRDQHFVVVNGIAENGDVRLYDPRLQHETQLSAEVFREQWSELAILFQAKPEGMQLASSVDLDVQMGGCCGFPLYPGDLGSSCPINCCGMPGWSVNPINLNVVVQDIPMWHDNQFGQRVEIKLTYNSEDSLNQMRPVGNKWVLNYASYAMVSPGGSPSPGSVLIIMPDGRGDIYQPNGNGGFKPPAGVFNTLTALSQVSAYAFNLVLPDGTTYSYGIPPEMGSGSFSSLLLSITDRYGNANTISHHADGSLNQVTDPLGKQWTFVYNAQGYVGQINDQFGRQATFSYDDNGNLIGQTDMGGVGYGYTYDGNVDLTALIKPSGTTKFYIEPAESSVTNQENAYPLPGGIMWEDYRVTITDPQGYAEEYYWDGYSHYGWHRDQNQYQSPLPVFEAPKTSFYYTQLSTNGKGVFSRITYADLNSTAFTNYNAALLLPQQITMSVSPATANTNEVDETTNLTYNTQGEVLTRQDARTNTTTYQYNSNGVVGNAGFDLATITDPTRNVRVTRGYDSARNVNSITDATSNTTQITWNATGQPAIWTNAAQHAFTYNYNSLHQLSSISQGSNTLRTFTYDATGRLESDTNVDGFTMVYEYDNLDRVIKVVYPDSTSEVKNYSCCWLDNESDRLGHVTYYTHDFRGRTLMTENANNCLVQSVYDPVGNLIELYDGNQNSTQWTYDARNRVTNKIYADGSIYSFGYDGVGNLTARTDAKNVTVNYTYDANNNPTGITAPGLTPITYAYDTRNWMTGMTDGVGTTTFGYDLAGRRNSINGPLDNDAINLVYDVMGRVGSQTVNGQSSSFTYNDNLERLTGSNTPIGAFTYTYRTPTSPQLAFVGYPNGQSTALSYYGPNQDNRLSQITNSTSSGILSQFGYQYDAAGQITQWTQQAGSGHPLAYQLQQDALGQLTGATVQDTVAKTVTQTYSYGYDGGGNRTAEQSGASLSQDSYNNLNQLTSRQGNGTGTMPFRGMVNKPSTVSVNGTQVPTKADGSFTSTINVSPGTNTVAVNATDQNNDTTNHSYQFAVAASGDTRTLTYDANGNLLSMMAAGTTTTYEWDALDRLTAINQGSNRSEFSYDGLYQRRRIIEKTNGSVTSEKHFTWLGMHLAEGRDSSSGSTSRFFAQGEQISGQNYFYSRDHLGSVRELVDGAQTVRARYSYDLYGVRSTNLVTASSVEADFGFTGHYFHQPSGLHLTTYRAYSENTGSWLSRDPTAEVAGPNLYDYVLNKPTKLIDPLGLWQFTFFGGYIIGGRVSIGNNGGSNPFNGQWNGSVQIGLGRGASGSFDVTSHCKKDGFNSIHSANVQVGNNLPLLGGYGGGGDLEYDGNPGEGTGSGDIYGRLGPFYGGISTDPSFNSGFTNAGGAVFIGTGFGWAF